jgi:hypothetical protein
VTGTRGRVPCPTTYFPLNYSSKRKLAEILVYSLPDFLFSMVSNIDKRQNKRFVRVGNTLSSLFYIRIGRGLIYFNQLLFCMANSTLSLGSRKEFLLNYRNSTIYKLKKNAKKWDSSH